MFLTFGSYANETESEAPKQYKSLVDRPDAVHQLRELKNCTITYYNIGVYANIGGSIYINQIMMCCGVAYIA